ncbi:cellulose synthase operon protein YhjQ/BcsQ [Aliidiomarina shirensis]|nr:cellulose synthase operon protein YhjQ/BcsQ [Aliidiomarina shirensis]
MNIIGVESVVGGSGGTSVVAEYAAALNDMGLRTIALDLNPENQLGLHFGLSLSESAGVSQIDQASSNILDVLFESVDGYPFIPFGYVPEVEWPVAIETLAERLSSLLKPILSTPDRVMVIDVSRSAFPLRDWVYRHADVMLNVIQPEPRAMPALIRYSEHQRRLQVAANCRSLVMFNAVAPHLDLSRDTLELLRSQITADAQCPILIHRDQHIPEAFASQKPVRSLTASAQSNRDFDALALWTVSYLNSDGFSADAEDALSGAKGSFPTAEGSSQKAEGSFPGAEGSNNGAIK